MNIMSFLDRLKNVFSGGEEPEKKDQAAKSETEKPPVEKETVTQDTVKEEPKTETPVDTKPAETPAEEKPVTFTGIFRTSRKSSFVTPVNTVFCKHGNLRNRKYV